MKAFPAEFDSLLTERAHTLLKTPSAAGAMQAPGKTPIAVFANVMARSRAAACVKLLDRAMRGALRRMRTPIPRETITGMRENYAELLPKTMRVQTADLNSRRSRAAAAAERIGLLRLMSSQSLRKLAETVTGLSLAPNPDRQVILYEPGDYSGPHNDHHPEEPCARDGYVDVHIYFSTPAVKNQLLVYEERGCLTEAVDVSTPSGLAVYRLPFWHYTTPLLAKGTSQRAANRWVLLSSYDIDR